DSSFTSAGLCSALAVVVAHTAGSSRWTMDCSCHRQANGWCTFWMESVGWLCHPNAPVERGNS
ncbi:MAG: hypothetical protein L6R28_25830, partial [Planctomycetes bacterium]|nr:hypothetical protein [Planctomycetota bacterium]